MALSRIKSWIAEILYASDLNAEFNNILNNALSLISPLTGNLDAGSNKVTSLGAPTALTDAMRLGDHISNLGIYYTTAGTQPTYTLTPSPAITAYAAGQKFLLKINATNTSGAATLNVSALGAKDIKRLNGTALVGGEMIANELVEVAYDGTNFILLTPGDRKLVAQTTITAVGSIDFTSLPTYFKRFRVEISGLRVGTDNVSLYLRLSESATFKSGATDYQYANVVLSRGSTTTQNEASAAQILLGTAIGNATGEGADGHFTLYRPSDAGAGVVNQTVDGRLNVRDAGSVLISNIVCGDRANTTPVAQDGIRLLPSSGNFATGGYLQLWGEL